MSKHKQNSTPEGSEQSGFSPGRRRFLWASGVTAVVAVTGISIFEAFNDNDEEAPEKEAAGEAYARSFPDKIENATVKKLIVPGSPNCLTHIEQYHDAHGKFTDQSWLRAENFQKTPEGRALFKHYRGMLATIQKKHDTVLQLIQGDIHTIVMTLHEKGLLNGVYPEGQTPETLGMSVELKNDIDHLEKMAQSYQQSIDTANKAMPIALRKRMFKEHDQLKKSRDNLVGDLAGVKRDLRDILEKVKQRTKKSATERLILEGVVQIRAGEKAELHALAMQKMEEITKKALAGEISVKEARAMMKSAREITDDREDDLLKTSRENGDRIPTTIFGEEHDWTNNIKQQNRGNPKESYSLITIRPNSMKWADVIKRDIDRFNKLVTGDGDQ